MRDTSHKMEEMLKTFLLILELVLNSELLQVGMLHGNVNCIIQICKLESIDYY